MNLFCYLNLGGGLPYFSSFFSAIIAIILSFLAVILAFLKRFYYRLKGKKWIIWVIIGLLLISAIIFFGSRIEMIKEKGSKKIIVLGIDALDPDIMQKLMQQDKLPNFKTLKKKGSFKKLSTVMPPQSPVVWASFSTGLSPGGHGIYDFVKCDSSYKLDLALTEVTQPNTFEIFGKKFRTGNPQLISGMKGKRLWEYLKEKGIPTYIYFLPNTFPPDKVNGKMISGMGVPDIYGTEGTFTFYTQDESYKERFQKTGGRSSGKIIILDKNKKTFETVIHGPRGMVANKKVTLPFNIEIEKDKVQLKVQKTQILLSPGEWSDWIRVKFKLGPFKKVYGICRFYLKNINPLELYLSPINFDPRNPFFTFTYPNNFSKKLVKKIGLYHTLGMPYDTKALNEDILSDSTFLQQANNIFSERKKILFKELPKFKEGIFIYYFNILDSIQHTFWRFLDRKSPLNKESPHKKIIYRYYEKVDKILGKVNNYVDENTTLIVLSDHGFAPFRRSFNINSWLRENGYLELKNPYLEKGRILFKDIDWENTGVFSAGLNSIYINYNKKRKLGIVTEEEGEELKQELKNKLKNLKDPKTNEKIIKQVYNKEDIYEGPFLEEAPDLIIGYEKGYRTSWRNALGGVYDKIFVNNLRKWSGTHLIDSSLVPGVIFSNREISSNKPNIKDLVPTILKLYNIPIPDKLEGKNIYK